jgi:hypothetical protein
MKDKASDKNPASTDLDDKALDAVVGGCDISGIGGPKPILIKGGTGGAGTGPVIEGGGGGIVKEPTTKDPGGILFPTK